jgi:phosphoglycerate kinase
MNLKTLNDMPDITGKRVFVRVDFNVPLDERGNVRDDKRIKHALPTIKFLLEKGAKQLILASHVGRPKNNEPELKTDKEAAKLGELLNMKVAKVDNWGENGVPDARIVMLENLRFNAGEKSKDETERDAFGKQMASLADFYVNEAFSNSHRKHASMTSVPKFIPGYAGLGVESEAGNIAKAIEKPKHPVVAVMGGLKADKLNAIKNMLEKVADKVLVAGALAYSLRKAQGYKTGSTKVDEEGLTEMADIVKEVVSNPKLLLPDDAIVADNFAENANKKTVAVDKIEDGWMALDIGPKTVKKYVAEIKKAKTVLWFGPIGVFEMEPFANGTKEIGRAIADSGAFSLVGGGDSASAVKKMGLSDRMSFVSTGGGASLEMIEGKELPALAILKK